MLESVIISTIAGSVICGGIMIFKNRILSSLGGKALYYISLIGMLVFLLPMNIGDISLPEIKAHQEIKASEFTVETPAETNINGVNLINPTGFISEILRGVGKISEADELLSEVRKRTEFCKRLRYFFEKTYNL